MFDLARVETLRGPQGTLFGRNATGGAIQFISRRPTREFEGYTDLTVDRYNQVIVDGAVSGPLDDSMQGRIAFIRNKDDGYMNSVIAGFPDRGGNDHYAVRGSLAWQPNDDTDVNLILRYLRADRETQAGLYSHEPACPNAEFQGEFTPPTVTCSYWTAFAPDPPLPGQATGLPGPGTTGSGYRNDSIIPSRGGDPWATAETQESFVDRKIFGSTLRIDADLGSVGLVAISDYQHSNKFYIEGGDSSPDGGVFFFQGSKLDQMSQEIRLSTTAGAHELVGGVFGMYVDGKYTGKFADPFYGYDPDVAMSQRTTSYALFLQDEWTLADRWKLIGGLRWWHDTRQGTYLGTEPSTGVTIIFNQDEIFPVFPGSPVTPETAKRSFSDVTARLELDYKPSDDALWYLSFNRGSKSGGYTFSTGTPFDTFQQAFLEGMPFDPEVLNAYEAGVKANLGDNTTPNVSAFYYDYKDYQAFAQVGVVQSVINLDAKAKGVEAELNARPIDGLTLQLGASFLDTNVENILLPDLSSVVDHDLPQAPSFSGNALVRYEFPLGGGTASVQADLQYSAKFCFTVLCAPVEKEDAYSVANARIGYAAADARWEVAAFVNNLADEEYRVYAFDSSLFVGVVAGVYGKPRTYGVTATWRFGAARN